LNIALSNAVFRVLDKYLSPASSTQKTVIIIGQALGEKLTEDRLVL